MIGRIVLPVRGQELNTKEKAAAGRKAGTFVRDINYEMHTHCKLGGWVILQCCSYDPQCLHSEWVCRGSRTQETMQRFPQVELL